MRLGLEKETTTSSVRLQADVRREWARLASFDSKDNTYMDDIIKSVGDRKRAENITQNIEKLVDTGGFKIKCWTNSRNSDSQNEEILSETYADQLMISFASR